MVIENRGNNKCNKIAKTLKTDLRVVNLDKNSNSIEAFKKELKAIVNNIWYNNTKYTGIPKDKFLELIINLNLKFNNIDLDAVNETNVPNEIKFGMESFVVSLSDLERYERVTKANIDSAKFNARESLTQEYSLYTDTNKRKLEDLLNLLIDEFCEINNIKENKYPPLHICTEQPSKFVHLKGVIDFYNESRSTAMELPEIEIPKIDIPKIGNKEVSSIPKSEIDIEKLKHRMADITSQIEQNINPSTSTYTYYLQGKNLLDICIESTENLSQTVSDLSRQEMVKATKSYNRYVNNLNALVKNIENEIEKLKLNFNLEVNEDDSNWY